MLYVLACVMLRTLEKLGKLSSWVLGGISMNIQASRALEGVLDNDEAKRAGLIIMDEFGAVKERNFKRFMGQAGRKHSRG